jgi:hypothetical protein
VSDKAGAVGCVLTLNISTSAEFALCGCRQLCASVWSSPTASTWFQAGRPALPTVILDTYGNRQHLVRAEPGAVTQPILPERPDVRFRPPAVWRHPLGR